MIEQPERIGVILKLIGNNPGIKLAGLLEKLKEEGLAVSEKTINNDIDYIKNKLKLLPNRARLREGYFLSDIKTVGTDETTVVVDALSAFGVNLNDQRALEISRRFAARSDLSTPRSGLRQRNIYRPASEESEVEELLSLSIADALATRIQLETPRADNPVVLTVYPLFRVFHERGWYLITKDVQKSAYFPCRIDRIQQCEILREIEPNAGVSEDISCANYLMNCGWGMDFPHTLEELAETEEQPEIVVRFDRTVARFIREGVNRHPKARTEPAPDGSGCVDFRIRLKYHNEFKRWVRSWGAKAWFVTPRQFVDEELAEIRRQLLNYGTVSESQEV